MTCGYVEALSLWDVKLKLKHWKLFNLSDYQIILFHLNSRTFFFVSYTLYQRFHMKLILTWSNTDEKKKYKIVSLNERKEFSSRILYLCRCLLLERMDIYKIIDLISSLINKPRKKR